MVGVDGKVKGSEIKVMPCIGTGIQIVLKTAGMRGMYRVASAKSSRGQSVVSHTQSAHHDTLQSG